MRMRFFEVVWYLGHCTIHDSQYGEYVPLICRQILYIIAYKRIAFVS